MRACPVPSAAVLCTATVLLLTLLAIVPTIAAVVSLNTTTPCPPASCGRLNITYPFWLTGTHPPECGYKAFQVTCDKGDVTLENPFWTYKVLDIFYQNSSFRVTNVNLSDGICDTELNANDLGLAPFRISHRNQELFFLNNCSRQARRLPRTWASVNCASNAINSFVWLAGNYRPDVVFTTLPGNCSVTSVMPVLGLEGATGVDYQRLLKGGFLLEYTAEDCDACKETGGQCRVDGEVFECHCSDGVSPLFCDSGNLIYG